MQTKVPKKHTSTSSSLKTSLMIARYHSPSYNAQQIYVEKAKWIINRNFFKTNIDRLFHERAASLLGVVATTCNTATL